MTGTMCTPAKWLLVASATFAASVVGFAQSLTKVDIAPADFTVEAGSYTKGAGSAFTITGWGQKVFASQTDSAQPGDVMTFAYEEVTGDFDKKVKVTGLTTVPADPIQAWARGGLMVRATQNAVSEDLKVVVANPAGANVVRLIGRGLDGQNYTTFSRDYAGVKDALPNQWIRLQRAGDYFAAYVGTDGNNWTLIGERYQSFPAKVMVGAYAAAQDDTGAGKAVVEYSDYGNVTVVDTIAPRLVSAGTFDKKQVGVKFSEIVSSASATDKANYQLSQGTISSVKMGIGGDAVYLNVSGVTSDTFTVTVGGVKDPAGNAVAAGSTVTVKSLNWFNEDSGFIQNPGARPTPGDDPYVVGEAVAVSSDENPEFELVGGGSNIWDGGDFMHYIYTQIPAGDFDYAIEVSRYDRPANTAGWGNSGIHVRKSVYREDDPGILPYTVDGTKVPNIAEVTYMEGSAPGRAGIAIWRSSPGGGYGAGGTIGLDQQIGGLVGSFGRLRAADSKGTPKAKTLATQNIWLRMQRKGTIYKTYVSYNGLDWVESVTQDRPDLGGSVLLGFATHNDTGGKNPPANAYANNGLLPDGTQDLNQNESNYTVQRVKVYPKGVAAPVPVSLTKTDIVPEDGSSIALAGSYTQTGTYSFDLTGGGTAPFRNAGDELTFASEEITGDFDKQVRISSISSLFFGQDGTAYVPAEGETLPVDVWAQGGLMARTDTGSQAASVLIAAANPSAANPDLSIPGGANLVRFAGRGLAGQNYTAHSRDYPGVSDALPNQWLRLRRVGDYFAAYVSANGVNWSLIGERYVDLPSKLLVGAYASAALDPANATANPSALLARAVVKFNDYKDVNAGDVVPPTLVSVGTLDKKTVGVKFSEPVSSATAEVAANYGISQGTITGARLGIGGDSVYLTVSGLTADTFTVTVKGGVKDSAGNPVAPGSSAQGSVSAWTSSDIGFIQDKNNRPTAGDDPYVVGSAVAISSGSSTEVEIVGGGSNGWDPGDFLHYLHKPISGDFDVAVEVSRYDRAANTAGWGNSGIHIRKSLYTGDDELYSITGTKVANYALVTYMEGSAPGRSGITIFRNENGGGYGAAGNTPLGTEIGGLVGSFGNLRAGNAKGEPKDKTSADQNIWLRVTRTGATLKSLISYDGSTWLETDSRERTDLSGDVLIGFATHNDTGGSAPPNNAYGGNTTPEQNASNYTVQRVTIYPNGVVVAPPGPLAIKHNANGSVEISWPGAGTLLSSDTLTGGWQPVAGAVSPFTVSPSSAAKYYRLQQ